MTAFNASDFLPYYKVFTELSSSEIKVLSLYCSGMSCNAIATQLNITTNTMHVHMKNARSKYNATSYSELRALFHFRVTGYLIKNCNISFDIREFFSYDKVFPEISDHHIKVLFLYCSFFEYTNIALKLDIKISTMPAYLEDTKDKYHLNSFSELKAFFTFRVTSYLLDHEHSSDSVSLDILNANVD